jgi:hypothetical protein
MTYFVTTWTKNRKYRVKTAPQELENWSSNLLNPKKRVRDGPEDFADFLS